MKSKQAKDKKVVRQEILQSALASFRIEGIAIPEEMALKTSERVELTLGKRGR